MEQFSKIITMQTYSSIWIHLIWGTKNRTAFLTRDIRFKVYDFIRDKAKEIDVYVDHINGVEDHVHILISIKPKHSVSDIAKSFKGSSSKWINDNLITPDYFDWQDGFSAFSVSPTHLKNVRAYIRNQEKHHAKMNYQSEIKMLVEKISGYI